MNTQDHVILETYPRYRILRDGGVYDLIKNRFIKQGLNNGYLSATLHDRDGNRKGVYIHRLLALAFIPNPDNKPVLDHKDRNKTNNDLSNLRWATSSENGHNMSMGVEKKYSDIQGVFYQPHLKRKPWYSTISINGARKNLGYFETEAEAAQAYQWAKALQ